MIKSKVRKKGLIKVEEKSETIILVIFSLSLYLALKEAQARSFCLNFENYRQRSSPQAPQYMVQSLQILPLFFVKNPETKHAKSSKKSLNSQNLRKNFDTW